jgi:hypothetical protein
MSRIGSPFESTLLYCELVGNNICVEIDTQNGYEYHKVIGCRPKMDGVLNVLFVDLRNNNRIHSVTIARATALIRERATEGREEEAKY